jgi:hypothetical protein
VSSLHLLGSGRLLAGSGLLASGRLLGSGTLLGNGEKREAGQNRKTDRPGNQVLSSHLTAPIQPHQKRMPKLLFHPQSKELAIGDARAETSLASIVARLPQRGAPRRGVSEVSLTMTAPSAPSAVLATMEIGRRPGRFNRADGADGGDAK